MQAPTLPPNEVERLDSLRRMNLLYTPDEGGAGQRDANGPADFSDPIVLISLVDHNRQWFKSCLGLPQRDALRDVSFCGHAILGDEIFVIEDASQDERFADNPR
jgi:GAF domain-containing protein